MQRCRIRSEAIILSDAESTKNLVWEGFLLWDEELDSFGADIVRSSRTRGIRCKMYGESHRDLSFVQEFKREARVKFLPNKYIQMHPDITTFARSTFLLPDESNADTIKLMVLTTSNNERYGVVHFETYRGQMCYMMMAAMNSAQWLIGMIPIYQEEFQRNLLDSFERKQLAIENPHRTEEEIARDLEEKYRCVAAESKLCARVEQEAAADKSRKEWMTDEEFIERFQKAFQSSASGKSEGAEVQTEKLTKTTQCQRSEPSEEKKNAEETRVTQSTFWIPTGGTLQPCARCANAAREMNAQDPTSQECCEVK